MTINFAKSVKQIFKFITKLSSANLPYGPFLFINGATNHNHSEAKYVNVLDHKYLIFIKMSFLLNECYQILKTLNFEKDEYQFSYLNMWKNQNLLTSNRWRISIFCANDFTCTMWHLNVRKNFKCTENPNYENIQTFRHNILQF